LGLFKQKKKKKKERKFFLTSEMPETTVRHRNTVYKVVHLCLIVREMLEILLTHSNSLSSLTAMHIRSEVLKLLHDLQRCKVVVLQSDLAAEPCW